ncbi:MAG: SRPBCC domain-containing protein [Aeromicrobium sp.]
MTDHVATAEVDISASPDQVWSALTDPNKLKRYFFGSTVESDWKPGSPVTWRGEYNGKAFEDRGEVVEAAPHRRLAMTHFSPTTGADDRPENYHQLAFELDRKGSSTHVRFTQDNNVSESEAHEAEENWRTMLHGLKELVERG